MCLHGGDPRVFKLYLSKAPLRAQLRDRLRVQLRDHLKTQTSNQLKAQFRDQLRAQLRGQLRPVLHHLNPEQIMNQFLFKDFHFVKSD